MTQYSRITPVEIKEFTGKYEEVEPLVRWLQERTDQVINSVAYQPPLTIRGVTFETAMNVSFAPSGNNRDSKNEYLIIEAKRYVVFEQGKPFVVINTDEFRQNYQKS